MLVLKDRPILFIRKINSLAITDLHFGIENELRKKGINLPNQKEKFLRILREAKEETKAKRLIIIGDVKHKVPGISLSELKNLKEFFEELTKDFKVIVAKGNHDDRLEDILENVKIFSSRGFKINEFAFFHGHAWPFSHLWNCKYFIVGHLQAAVEIREKNVKEIKKVIIKSKPKIKKGNVKEIIVLPSFNDFAGNFIINKNKELTGIFQRIIDPENSEVFLLNGISLGSIKDLS
ncbi:MAG: metallophosphoesterase [Candidatus Aenigmatarchaeota archaeon]